MPKTEIKRAYLGLAVLATLTACSEPQVILTGEREGIREVLGQEEAAPALPGSDNISAPFAAPSQTANADWTQAHASPATRTDHPALGAGLAPAWRADIGAGDSRRARLTAAPVVSAGRVFTLDAAARVTATSTAGETLWTHDLTPARDREDEAQGGALAVGDGRLYVTSGYGTVTALDPATGAVTWEQRLGNTGNGAPSYYDGLVYLVSGDSTAWALEADSGRIRWQIDNAADVVNVAGGPAPAVNDTYVVFGFGSGDIQAAFRKGGLRLWSATLAGRRDGVAMASIDDITGGPVIVNGTLYAGNHSGSTVALSLGGGERAWTTPVGALEAPWVAGGSVFLISDQNRLVRLDATDGSRIWEVELPGYVERRRPNRRRDSAYANHGPVLAGGRLIVGSSDGQIRAFDPTDGSLLESVAVPGGVSAPPVVAEGTLYVVGGNGELFAFR